MAGTRGEPAATTIQVELGQRFPIALEANPTTGYRWRLEDRPNEEVVQLVGSEYRRSEHDLPGAGGKEVFTFRAVGRGKAVVSLGYARPWEAARPALMRKFVVVVG